MLFLLVYPCLFNHLREDTLHEVIYFLHWKVKYQREIERLEKENRDLRKEIILKRQKSDGKKRRMKVVYVVRW